MSMKDDDNDDEAQMVALGVAKILAIFAFALVVLALLAKATITFF